MRGRRTRTLLTLALAVALTLTLTLAGFQSTIAQQAPKVAVNMDATECSDRSQEVAYKTLVTFVPWLLARAGRMNPIGDAEHQAIFRTFAEKQLWRTGIAEGDDIEG